MVFQDAMAEFGFDCKVRKLPPRSIDNCQKQLRYLQTHLADECGIKNVGRVKTVHIKQCPCKQRLFACGNAMKNV